MPILALLPMLCICENSDCPLIVTRGLNVINVGVHNGRIVEKKRHVLYFNHVLEFLPDLELSLLWFDSKRYVYILGNFLFDS